VKPFDRLVVLLAAPLWLPVMALVAVVVFLGLGRPLLFRQRRAGRNGVPFTIFKFRTMREGAGTDAERLTRLGRFLRASSLDELPELFNVLRGEMALVGPRPLPVEYLPRYSPEQNRRHEVKPGMTGWAQVNGRNMLDWETKFRYDVDYVDSRSFFLDLKILWLTVWQVFAARGISAAGEATMGEFTGRRDDHRPPAVGLRVLHVTADVAGASGVGTFVRRINEELNRLGVDSGIVTDIDSFRQSASPLLIVHIHGLWLGLHHAAAKWARVHGAKIVWSTHGMTAPWAMRHKRWKKLPAWGLYQKRDLKNADLIHSTTEMEARWNRAVGLVRTCIVPLGTDLPERVESGGGRGAADVKTLLFVGRVYPVKALDRLIGAFSMVRHEGWKLRIVGPDEDGHLAELKKLVVDLGCGRDVEFAGPKYGAELESEYVKCEALALVSHTENFGATVVDALAHSKPVITSTKTPWSVVADTPRCGWWVDNDPATLAKAIEELTVMSGEARAAMGANGRRLVEAHYTWSAVGRRMVETYEKLTGGRA